MKRYIDYVNIFWRNYDANLPLQAVGIYFYILNIFNAHRWQKQGINLVFSNLLIDINLSEKTLIKYLIMLSDYNLLYFERKNGSKYCIFYLEKPMEFFQRLEQPLEKPLEQPLEQPLEKSTEVENSLHYIEENKFSSLNIKDNKIKDININNMIKESNYKKTDERKNLKNAALAALLEVSKVVNIKNI